MVHTLMMNSQLERQQQKQQQQQLRQVNKCGKKDNARGAAAIIYRVGGVGAVSSAKVVATQHCWFPRRFKVACVGGRSGGVDVGSGSGICLWLVLLVFMLILCGNTVISQQQQQQRPINSNHYHNNNGNQNNSTISHTNNNIDNNNNNNINNSSSGNILLQISTPSNENNNKIAAGNDATASVTKTGTNTDDVDVVEVATDAGAGNQATTTTITNNSSNATLSSSTATNGNSDSSSSRNNNNNSNAPSLKYGESGNKTNNKATTVGHAKLTDAANDNEKNANNDADDDNDDLKADDDLDNSSELLNESEDGYEHSSVSPTTYRPTRPTPSPQLTLAQERERRLMNVLAARRSALHRPGFRNRIGTTGRTATAVETTSKSPTDPRSICIRNCTKNFTRRTTASCMRQCANFSRVANAANTGLPGAGAAGNVVMVKNSSKSGTGTALAGEKDTNEILFTDESSHGLLVIAKEQNDTANHITDENKANGSVIKLRGRRKPNTNTVTVATTSIEDDEIQPYLYFGQKLPPLKPNALTITSVSDEHPKLLEVSVADASTTSTTPATSTASSSTLSAVEKSRSRFKYNMRGGVSFNRRYTTLNRERTTPEMPLEVRTTTLRIVTEKPKSQKVREKPENLEETTKVMEPMVERLTGEEFREESIMTVTPLIITVLSDEEMMTPKVEGGLNAATTLTPIIDLEPISSTSESTSTTTTTTTTAPSTTTARTTTSTTTQVPKTKPPRTTTTTTSTSTSTIATPISTTTKTTTTPTTTTTTTTTELPTASTTTTTTRKSNIIEEDKELLRALGPSLTQHINTEDGSNLIIFVNHTSRPYQGTFRPARTTSTTTTSTTTEKPPQQLEEDTFNPNAVYISSTILTPVQFSPKSKTKDTYSTTHNPLPPQDYDADADELPPSSTTSAPQVTGEISSTVVTDDQEISLEMHRMNIVTMVLAGIGIIPLLAIILYLLRNYLLKRPIKNEEDFDVCITDQQPISPVKKLEAKYKEGDEDEVDHHKKPPQRQHSLHSKLVVPPLARDNNHNHQIVTQKRYDDKSSIASDQEFERSNIRLKSLLGEGNFGQVWKAEADDLSGHFGATRIVAVKTIKACSTQLSLKDEGNIMRKLGSHQNVVTLLGACVETEPHMLIMEYAMRGRLLSLLRAARNATNILPASVPGGRSLTPLSPRTLAGFCLDIARGMEYISEKRIVHRDLAARNVLLDHNGVCKICDFGMSIDLDAERKRKEQEKNCANEIMRSNFNKFKFDFGGKFIMHHWPTTAAAGGGAHKDGCNEKKSHGHDTIGKRPALPIRWMAPESLQYNIFSTETDIWAFGIVLWEIATLGSTPYSQLTGREVIRRVPQGLRPDLPKEGRHEFYNLMSRCWHKDPNMRPSFSQCRLEVSRSVHKWVDDDSAASDYMDVSGFSEDLEQGMVYFNHRISEFECEI